MAAPDRYWLKPTVINNGPAILIETKPREGFREFIALTPALSELIEAAMADINNESDFWMRVDSAVFALRKSIIAARTLPKEPT